VTEQLALFHPAAGSASARPRSACDPSGGDEHKGGEADSKNPGHEPIRVRGIFAEMATIQAEPTPV
jgi:hypothetical protein